MDFDRGTPVVVIVQGEPGASSALVSTLARLGVTEFAVVDLEPPFDDQTVSRCLTIRNDAERLLKGIVRCLVGEVSLKEAQHRVREAMLEEALSASRGSRRSAARLLGVTRPAVQRMLRERDEAAGGERGA